MERWAILAALALIRLSFGYQFESMAVLAPRVSEDLDLSLTEAGTLIGVYWAPGMVVALPGGWLGRRFGDKAMVIAGGLLTVAGGVLCAAADSGTALAAGRAIAGLGGIVMNVLAVKMAADWFAGREIGFAMGALFGSFPLGIALGLAAQPPLAAAAGWPAVMASTALLGGAVVAAITLVYRPPPAAAPAAGTTGGAELLTRRDFALMTAAGIGLALYNGSFLVYVSYAPMLLTDNGVELARAGFILAGASVVSTLAVPLGGHLADRSGRPRALLFGGTLAFVACASLLPLAAAGGGEWSIAAVTLLIAVLGALPISPMVALPSEAIAAPRRAVGLGLFYTWFYLGAALCPALGGWLYEVAGTPAAPIYLIAALGAATLAFYAGFATLERRRR